MSTGTLQETVDGIGLALGLVALAALSSPVLQLCLRPVFGAISASTSQNTAVAADFMTGTMIHLLFGKRGSMNKLRSWLPFMVACVHAAEHFISRLSDTFGPFDGMVPAGVLSCHLVIISCAFITADVLQELGIRTPIGENLSTLLRGGLAFLFFVLLERFFAAQLPEIVTGSKFLAPADIQLIISAAFMLLCSSEPAFVVGTGALVISIFIINPHGSSPYATRVLQHSLSSQHWTLLDRQWSNTGYISVLESTEQQYRVLRCDHSLLGGEWLINEERRKQGWTGNEPIYSVFTMLEAVRLIDANAQISDADAKALVVGLGIGTAPKAFLQHNIDTTIVELDPVVYKYATQYFDLPANHTAVLQDAVSWARKQADKDDFDRPQFDYVIHDVFTGGAEPLSLFTSSFLKDLRALLSSDGVAAINYAGDLNISLTRIVLNTIDLTFDRQCEVYSDHDASQSDTGDDQFSNFVVFCQNAPGELTFRKPTSSDYLGSLSRRSYLLPKPDQRVRKSWLDTESDAAMVLRAEDTSSWHREQAESAKKHWHIMRTVLPARVWEMY